MILLILEIFESFLKTVHMVNFRDLYIKINRLRRVWRKRNDFLAQTRNLKTLNFLTSKIFSKKCRKNAKKSENRQFSIFDKSANMADINDQQSMLGVFRLFWPESRILAEKKKSFLAKKSYFLASSVQKWHFPTSEKISFWQKFRRN